MGKVHFVKATVAAYNSLSEKDEDTLYFVSANGDFDPTSPTNDVEGDIYLGSTLLTRSANHYGTCATLSAVAGKAVTVADNDFVVKAGAVIMVMFTYGNEAESPTISVNGGDAYPVAEYVSQDETWGDRWGVGETVGMVFNGTSWVVMKRPRYKFDGASLMVSTRQRPDYLKFTALEDNSRVRLRAVETPAALTLEYAVNGCAFMAYTIGDYINLDAGDYAEMRHTEGTVITRLGGSGSSYNGSYYQFQMSGKIAASGNVMSLLDARCRSKRVDSACFVNLFSSCSAMVSAPELPATTLGNMCYWQMFSRTSIEYAPYLPATTLGSSSYRNMFYVCANLKRSHVATLNSTTQYMYNGNSSAESLTIDAVTPPTITSSTLTGLKSTCIIYVPAESVDAYKAKQYWSARANYIQAKPEIVEQDEYTPYTSEMNVDGCVKDLHDARISDTDIEGWNGVYTVEELATPEQGYLRSYKLMREGVAVDGSDTINIPNNYLVKSVSVEEVVTPDVPYQGAQVGDKYIDFVVSVTDSQGGHDEHIYIPVSDLITPYEEGNGIDISSSNVISVKIDASNANGLSCGASGVGLSLAAASSNGVGGSAGAMSALDKEKLDSLSGGVNADWEAVSGPAEILNKPTSLSDFEDDLGNNPTHTHSQYLEAGDVVDDKNYKYEWRELLRTVTIQHNLMKYPSVTIVDTAGSEIIADVTHVDYRTVTISFSAPTRGTAFFN